MKAFKEFENLCDMLLEDASGNFSLPEISVGVGNLFYEYFGMSSDEIRKEFHRSKTRE